MIKVPSEKLFGIWFINALLCVAGFFIYRFFIIQKLVDEPNFFLAIFTYGLALLKVLWSQVFFLLMLFGALTIFLNLVPRVVNSFFLSLLTFLLIPFSIVCYFVIDSLISGIWAIDLSFIIDWIMPPVSYCLFTSVQFLLFRKYVARVRNEMDVV